MLEPTGGVDSLAIDFIAHVSSRSQFYVTFKATPNLDKKHTVFGKLVGGEDVLDALEKLPLKDGTERPAKPVRITEIVMCVQFCCKFLYRPTSRSSSYQDPFEEYKTRLAKKLARRATAELDATTQQEPAKKDGDDMNWFGVKVGTTDSTLATNSVDVGVGKYLNLKRPQQSGSGVGEESKKKRKIGFGDFDQW